MNWIELNYFIITKRWNASSRSLQRFVSVISIPISITIYTYALEQLKLHQTRVWSCGCQVWGSGWTSHWASASYPDLIPLDYFAWGHVKSLIYDTHMDIEFELLARILVARDVIMRHLEYVFERVRQSFFRRCNACIENGRRQFQHLL
jgi:hypothetical protein